MFMKQKPTSSDVHVFIITTNVKNERIKAASWVQTSTVKYEPSILILELKEKWLSYMHFASITVLIKN